jgi:high-affinity Fe2+/Pb2+ permease
MMVAHIPDLSPEIFFLLFLAGMLTVLFFTKKTPTAEAVALGLIFAGIAAFLIYAMFATRR